MEEDEGTEDEQHTGALVATFRERVALAEDHQALSAALAEALAGLWSSFEDGELTVEFELASRPSTASDTCSPTPTQRISMCAA